MRFARCITAFGLLPTALTLAQSNVDPTDKWSWSENAGWLNWRDAAAASQGAMVQATFLSGFVWAENAGWINLGDGDPGLPGGNEAHYANAAGVDFGVNRDASTSELFGFAWGENIGWINFEGGALATPPNPARVESAGGACRLGGFAWAENVGWINLDDATHFVGLDSSVCTPCPGPRGDANCDGAANFFDIDPFLLALFDIGTYRNTFCGGLQCTVDASCDGNVDFFDIDPFLTCLFGGCPPCP
jgi:hypothetical protein